MAPGAITSILSSWNASRPKSGPGRRCATPPKLPTSVTPQADPLEPAVAQAATPVGAPDWTSANRVYYERSLLSAGDDYLRAQLDPAALATLRSREYGHILSPEDTVPEELLPLFKEFASAAAEVWKLNDGLQLMVREERLRLKLGRGRNNGRTSGRAPIVGAHIRLGDKEKEWERDMKDFGIKNRYGNLSVYWEGESHELHLGA